MPDSIDRLNGFLRGEISAVETYNQVLEKTECSNERETLALCQVDHAKRVQILKNRIESLGGVPAENSGVWGAMARLLEAGAAAIGTKVALDMLEEGEDHGIETYRSQMYKLDPDNLSLVETQLLPSQEQTHRAIRDLRCAAA
jgi:demethoxyubiquinone hydroxylase (CLK1/Coq7/Cat5 family)